MPPTPAVRSRAAALLLAGLPWLAGCTEQLFFHPDQVVYTTPEREGVKAVDVWFEAEDGSRLHGWWLPSARPGPATCTVVHAHGNAANVSNHLPMVAWLPAQGVNVFTFDYRGFGKSQGKPSLGGLVTDLEAALRTARQQPGVQADQLMLLGQSLGGATSVRAAQRSAPGTLRGLILDSAFASYRGIGREVAAQSSLKWIAPLAQHLLPPEADDPLVAVRSLHMPLWVIHGEADAVIGVAHAEQLYAAAPSPKQLLRVPQGAHIDALMRPDVRLRVMDAIGQACASPVPASPA